MIANKVRELLRRNELALGIECGVGDPLLAELMAAQGFDWVLLDGQHGTWQRQSFALGFMGVRAGGATPFARVAQNEYFAIGHLLDEGALGIVVALVENAEEAERVRDASRLPPRGARSVGYGGATAYGPDYLDSIDNELVVAIQIESARGVENADEIMATEGIDACWVGPGDLSRSIGPCGRFGGARRGGASRVRGLSPSRQGRGNLGGVARARAQVDRGGRHPHPARRRPPSRAAGLGRRCTGVRAHATLAELASSDARPHHSAAAGPRGG